MLLEGGRLAGNDYADHAEAAAPVVLGRVVADLRVTVDWDGQPRTIGLATTELFMPVLGVGDAAATIGMFCRKQKGRHFVL
ncbi:MAG: hypothetical protein M3O36_16260 [Myxococcota bacterium]|nr:hypothetical protein [Myxococcota bacterium]